ncbi:MAG TPA: tetratricopeptide repeat protein [Vicinamibacterales bacterium]|nr:tetratricopeptide repeat protein [Vicinamibacterales bacterium]
MSFWSLRRLVVAVILALVTPVLVFGEQRNVAAEQAWAALERGDAAKAAAIFREELERSPGDATLHFGAGYAAFILGRHDAALSALKRALEYNPRFLQAAVLLAQVAYASADLDLAIRSLEKAAALAPGDRRIAQQLEMWRKESALHGALTETPGVRFRVLFEGQTQQALGDRVARVLESAYWTVGKTLNTYPSETLTVILYTDRQFQDVTRAPAWAGGGYDGRIRLAVGGALKTPRALDRVVVHEFVHAAIASIAPRNVPGWVNEGLASVLDSNDRTWSRRVLRQTTTRIALEDLEGGFGDLDGPTALLAYAESAVAAEILCERLGPNLGPFLQMLGSGHTVDQALSTLNVQPEAFHAEWRRRMQ